MRINVGSLWILVVCLFFWGAVCYALDIPLVFRWFGGIAIGFMLAANGVSLVEFNKGN
jgi:hypothetical protein